jgi:hypothetical protein
MRADTRQERIGEGKETHAQRGSARVSRPRRKVRPPVSRDQTLRETYGREGGRGQETRAQLRARVPTTPLCG